MKTRKWAAAIAVTALGLGLIGAGVAAQFSENATATQRIDVGTMGIVLTSDTPGSVGGGEGVPLTCPPIRVTSSAAGWLTGAGNPFPTCHVMILSEGDIAPESVTVTMQVEGTAALQRYMMQINSGAGNWVPADNGYGWTPMLDTVDGDILFVTDVLPADFYADFGNMELVNADMGDWLQVTFEIEAVA